ncbi:unnamed protein product [Vitrella brassicaformis CCMP3155]|uniref:SbsA Ig-like domain-containing protein n=1 Tax=Vitrella brassicaformis (strain CCMP3155) TaxID=1169540 RepID=A0A0G4H5I1_VITBC|nr:unnamed protein product [Vitrella brassicaformis CCMP3155]|eukprot:CEM39056.1 unnamed protein product [Vitrella brassicaformis CCMP3155]
MAIGIALCLFAFFTRHTLAQKQQQQQQQDKYLTFRESGLAYIHPREHAQYVSPFTTIALRHGEVLLSDGLEGKVKVSARDEGQTVLSSDQRTLIYKPATPNKPLPRGERVTVLVKPGIKTVNGTVLPGVKWSFTVSGKDPDGGYPGARLYAGNDWAPIEPRGDRSFPFVSDDIDESEIGRWPPKDAAGQVPLPPPVADMEEGWYEAPYNYYKTIPDHLPRMRVRGKPKYDQLAPGYFFMSNNIFDTEPFGHVWHPAVMVVDNHGDLVYHEYLGQQNSTRGNGASVIEMSPKMGLLPATPNKPLPRGERVTVLVKPGIKTVNGTVLPGVKWSFTVSGKDPDGGYPGARLYAGNDWAPIEPRGDRSFPFVSDDIDESEIGRWPPKDAAGQVPLPPPVADMEEGWYEAPYNYYKTIPDHLPRMRVRGKPKYDQLAPGYFFMSNNIFDTEPFGHVWHPAVMVVDNHGDLVYHEYLGQQNSTRGNGASVIEMSPKMGLLVQKPRMGCVLEKDQHFNFERRHHPEHGVKWSFTVSGKDPNGGYPGARLCAGNDWAPIEPRGDRSFPFVSDDIDESEIGRWPPKGAAGQVPLPPPVADMEEGWYEAPYNYYKTIPDHLPRMRVRGKPKYDQLAPGYFFMSNNIFDTEPFGHVWHPAVMVVDNHGDLVYHEYLGQQNSTRGNGASVIEMSPKMGLLVQKPRMGCVLEKDQHFNFERRHHPEHGYKWDPHDMRMNKEGNRVFTIDDPQPINVKGMWEGAPDTAVKIVGAVVQEIDRHNNVVMEFRSWDHFELPWLIKQSDSPFDDTQNEEEWDLIHQNSADFTDDASIVISWRRLSGVLKVDRETGNVVWRLGGTTAFNQFNFTQDTVPKGESARASFSGQHDASLKGNRLTVFDNGSPSAA